MIPATPGSQCIWSKYRKAKADDCVAQTFTRVRRPFRCIRVSISHALRQCQTHLWGISITYTEKQAEKRCAFCSYSVWFAQPEQVVGKQPEPEAPAVPASSGSSGTVGVANVGTASKSVSGRSGGSGRGRPGSAAAALGKTTTSDAAGGAIVCVDGPVGSPAAAPASSTSPAGKDKKCGFLCGAIWGKTCDPVQPDRPSIRWAYEAAAVASVANSQGSSCWWCDRAWVEHSSTEEAEGDDRSTFQGKISKDTEKLNGFLTTRTKVTDRAKAKLAGKRQKRQGSHLVPWYD